MNTRQIPESEWAHELQNFTNRNAGRRTLLEEHGPDLGAQLAEQGCLLRGVAYDRHDRRIEIMLGELEGADQHLTHSVAAAANIEVVTDQDGRDWALRIARPDGQTLLRFDVD